MFNRRSIRPDVRMVRNWPLLRHLLVVAAILAAMQACLANATAQEAKAESTIAYRLPDGKTMHFDDPKKAAEHLQGVKKLGCEVARSEQTGQGDVTYRCPKWKALTVADDKLAHQWEEWLEAAGFDTLHGHAADDPDHHAGEAKEHADEHAHEHAGEAGKHEEISYRLPGGVTLRPQKEEEAQELIAIFKGLGCELRETRREGQIDISIGCAEWMHLDLASHEAAEFWQQYLTKTGFEVKHEDEHEATKAAP